MTGPCCAVAQGGGIPNKFMTPRGRLPCADPDLDGAVDAARSRPRVSGPRAGAEWRLASGVSFLAKFDGEFGDRSQTYTGTGRIRYTW
jgi:hypothetical protein